jgi:hypothetical protein
VPESRETLSTADNSGAGSSEKKQQMAADTKSSPAAKTSIKGGGATSAASPRTPVDSDATAKTEVNLFYCYKERDQWEDQDVGGCGLDWSGRE